MLGLVARWNESETELVRRRLLVVEVTLLFGVPVPKKNVGEGAAG